MTEFNTVRQYCSNVDLFSLNKKESRTLNHAYSFYQPPPPSKKNPEEIQHSHQTKNVSLFKNYNMRGAFLIRPLDKWGKWFGLYNYLNNLKFVFNFASFFLQNKLINYFQCYSDDFNVTFVFNRSLFSWYILIPSVSYDPFLQFHILCCK